MKTVNTTTFISVNIPFVFAGRINNICVLQVVHYCLICPTALLFISFVSTRVYEHIWYDVRYVYRPMSCVNN
jgi:hypothetical protein